MNTASIWFYVVIVLGVVLVAAVQFALCFFKPLAVKLVPLILLGIAWVTAQLGLWHAKIEFLANGERFIMMAVSPLAILGMVIGWGVYSVIKSNKKA